MYLLGMAISLFFLGFTIHYIGGNLGAYMSIPDLISFFLIWTAILTSTKSFNVFYAGMRTVIFPKTELSEDMRGRAASLFRLLSKSTAIASALIFMVFLINLLMGLDWSHPKAFNIASSNMAVYLITPFYGLWFIFAVFEPAVYILKKRLPNDKNQ